MNNIPKPEPSEPDTPTPELDNPLLLKKTLSNISATKTKTTYSVGDTLSTNDINVVAHYSDDTTASVTSSALISTSDVNMSSVGNYDILVSYTDNGVTKTTTISIVVANVLPEPEPDNITLPDGYTRLEYVEADGQQYINTCVSEKTTAHAIYNVAFTKLAVENGNHVLSSANTYFPFLKKLYGAYVIGSKLTGSENFTSGSTKFKWEYNQKYTIEGYINGACRVNGNEIFTIAAGSTANANNKFYLFTYGGNLSNKDYYLYGKLYDCKIYDTNEELIRDFIPCKNSENIAGLYDLVTKEFYHSNSGTELIAGKEV